MCGAEGFPELACLNVGWSDLGTCVVDPVSFQEEALPPENACAAGEFSGGSLCCPVLLGGDGAGWGLEKPEVRNGIDMDDVTARRSPTGTEAPSRRSSSRPRSWSGTW